MSPSRRAPDFRSEVERDPDHRADGFPSRARHSRRCAPLRRPRSHPRRCALPVSRGPGQPALPDARRQGQRRPTRQSQRMEAWRTLGGDESDRPLPPADQAAREASRARHLVGGLPAPRGHSQSADSRALVPRRSPSPPPPLTRHSSKCWSLRPQERDRAARDSSFRWNDGGDDTPHPHRIRHPTPYTRNDGPSGRWISPLRRPPPPSSATPESPPSAACRYSGRHRPSGWSAG